MENITSQELKEALEDDGHLMIAIREPLRQAITAFYFKKYGHHIDPEVVEDLLNRVGVRYEVDEE